MFAAGQVGGYGFRIIEVSFPLERKRRHLLRQTSFRQFGWPRQYLVFQAGKQLYADVLPVGIRFEQFLTWDRVFICSFLDNLSAFDSRM